MSKDTKSELLSLYFRFTALTDSLKGLYGGAELTPDIEALLQVLCAHWNAGSPLSVRQVLQFERLGSSATIFKRLKRLRQMDLVMLLEAPDDPRKRQIVPTTRALDYFSSQALAIRAASA
jgi:hypothetical protein